VIEMDNNNNTDKKDNKSFDDSKENNDNNTWPLAYLIDNIFNDLFSKTIEDKNRIKINKYVYQAVTKFVKFRRKSAITFFDITIKDLSNETGQQLNEYIADCNSEDKIHQKLDGIMTEVIALIYKQAESYPF